MRIRKAAAMTVATLITLTGCSSDDNPCEELEQLTAEDPAALAAEAADPDGLFQACAAQIGELWQDMTPAEREAFLQGD